MSERVLVNNDTILGPGKEILNLKNIHTTAFFKISLNLLPQESQGNYTLASIIEISHATM